MFNGCMFSKEDEDNLIKPDEVKKAIRYAGCLAVLGKDHKLYLHTFGKDYSFCMDGVWDISGCNDTILIAKESGEVLFGVGKIKKLLQSGNRDAFQVMRP